MANLHADAMALSHNPGNALAVPYAWGTTAGRFQQGHDRITTL
ncbi:MAG: hypothetical protein AAF509_17610 [Pseudomonadota bacterium]